MNKISFNYTRGKSFIGPNLNNPAGGDVADYTGYYNITDNLIYSGRQLDDNAILLTSKDNILANYINSRYFFDRSTNENIELTYSAESLEFQPSEYINQNSINEKLKMLNDNFLDLYNFCFIRDNNIPANYTSYIGVTGDGNDYLNTSTILNQPNFSTSNVGLLSARGFEVIGMNLNASDGFNTPLSFLLVYFTPTTIFFYKADNTGSQSNITFLLSSDRADGTFSQPYVNITDITSNNVDTIFVTDSYHNQIYRLYVDPILKESRIANNNFALLGTGGIKLTTGGTDFLSGSNLVYYFNDEVYTYNQGTRNITVLDDDLSYRRSFTNKDLTNNLVADFAANPIDSKLYILLDNFKILTIDTEFNTEASILTPTNMFKADEEPRRLLFSGNDSSIYYLITTKNVYKYINKEKDDFIGDFKWYKYSSIDIPDNNHQIFDAKILPENQDYDSLFIFDKNTTYNGVDKLLRFVETNKLITCLEDRAFKIFDMNDILVKDQYFNNITFNKSLKKIIFNLDNLSTHIQSQFTYLYNDHKDLVYNSNLVLSKNINVGRDYNFFVGVNERITPQVFNRCIDNIYNYQQTILTVLVKQIKNLKYPYTEVVTF